VSQIKKITHADRIYTLDPQKKPAIYIDSGEELWVDTIDAFEGIREPEPLLALKNNGAATGPIYINGAEPGDSIQIDFISITPKGNGSHMILPKRGFLMDEMPGPYPTTVTFKDGFAVLPSGIQLPLAPSMGVVATTPLYSQLTASDSGPYGGDIDMKELVAGTSLILPVFVPGALLAMGDCHAIVGDGAVAGTGIECSSDTLIRVTVHKGKTIPGPRAITQDHFWTLSYGEDLHKAMSQSVRNMVDFLVKEKGMQPYDAYTLTSLAGDSRINRTFRKINAVKMRISRHALDQVDKLRTG